MLAEVIDLVSKLGTMYHSPLKQLVLDAWDLFQLIQIISKSQRLYNKVINLIDIPSKVLNESLQLRRSILKRFLSEVIPLSDDNYVSQNDYHLLTDNIIKFIQVDNIIVSIHNILQIIGCKKNIQIIVVDFKLKTLIKTYLRIITKCSREVIDNKVAIILDDIISETFLYENSSISVVGINDFKYESDLTIFFSVSPDITWSSNIGHLWLSGRDRELLGLTARVDWQKMLHISPETYVFCKERDLPQWQRIHECQVARIKVSFPLLKLHTSNSTTKISDLNLELTIRNNEINDLICNQYTLYIKNVLKLKPKKTIIEKDTKIFDIFNSLVKNKSLEMESELQLLLQELKNIDYFYYKKIQSFLKGIPQWKYPPHSISVGALTITYNSNPCVQHLGTTEINYYSLANSIYAKDVINGVKTNLMTQAICINTDNIKFNIISPDWHSDIGINKRTIEISKEVVNKYKETINSAWKSFLQAEIENLKFDINRTPRYYKYFERIK